MSCVSHTALHILFTSTTHRDAVMSPWLLDSHLNNGGRRAERGGGGSHNFHRTETVPLGDRLDRDLFGSRGPEWLQVNLYAHNAYSVSFSRCLHPGNILSSSSRIRSTFPRIWSDSGPIRPHVGVKSVEIGRVRARQIRHRGAHRARQAQASLATSQSQGEGPPLDPRPTPPSPHCMLSSAQGRYLVEPSTSLLESERKSRFGQKRIRFGGTQPWLGRAHCWLNLAHN